LVGGVMPVDSLMGTSVSVFDATTGRLESLTHNDNKGNAEVKYEFEYDTYSRITAIPETRPQVRDASNQPYEYDLIDQTTNQGFGFDANGNRTGGGYFTNRDNRLVNSPAYVYTYDAEGNRAKREAYSVSVLNNGHVQAVDDSPTPTANSGTWISSPVGYGGGQQIGSPTTFYRATATWKAPALPAGSYAVYATWAPLTNGLTTEPFTITTIAATGGSQTTTSAPMNFTLAPGGLDYDSAKWTQIGTVTSTGTEAVSVTLSTGTNWSGAIPADAIIFKPTGLDVARTTYEWDHQNRLTKVTNESAAFPATGGMTLSPRDTTTYAYDVLGRRVAVTYDEVGPADGGRDFRRVSVYDGSQVVWSERGDNREQMAGATITQALLWAPGTDQLLAIQERLGGSGLIKEPVWTLTDHLGTVKDYLAKAPTTGAESGLLLTRRYSAFGTPVAAKMWNTAPSGIFSDISGKSGFFYVGQEYDATTGLQYSRARYYDPVSSEFISQDPLGFAGGDTNLYRRAGNSPANATDPSGLFVLQAAGAVVGGVHGAFETLAANPDASAWEIFVGAAIGAAFGAINPVGSFLSAGGAVLGGAVEVAAGGDFLGKGFQAGGLVGGIAGGFASAARAQLGSGLKQAAAAGARAVALEASGAAVGAGVGYARTGTFAGALHGANIGMFAGGIAQGVRSWSKAAVPRSAVRAADDTSLPILNREFNPNSASLRKGTAFDFYTQRAGATADEALDHMRGIDFLRPVEIVRIPEGTLLQQWVHPKGLGRYFAPPGSTPLQSGISSTRGRTLGFFRAESPVEALRSFNPADWAYPAGFTPGAGGGLQYFVPNPRGLFSRL
jgi:RHS repeat-associated protein